MLVFLALHGCSAVSDPPTTIEATPEPEAPPVAAIATVPERRPFARADVIPSPLPAGEPIVRMECFGSRGGEFAGGMPVTTKPTSPGRGPFPSPPASPAAGTTPRPDAITEGSAKKGTDGFGGLGHGTATRSGGGGFGSSGEQGVVTGGDLSDSTVAVPTVPTGQIVTALPGDGRAAAPTEVRRAREAQDPAKEATEAAKDEENRDAPARLRKQGKSEPTFDWGATVYLSNDDSMSLASAQRLLYGLSHQVRLTPGEIRPHELLNYFSFDTVAPAAGQTFGVLGAAEQHGDTLTVSLAVRGANPARQPLDLTVLLDRSCSMSAEDRMGYTRRGLHLLSDNLQRGDRLDVVLFDSGSCTPLENYVVGRDDPQLLTSVIDQLQPTSGTNLDAGLKAAYAVQTGRDAADTHGRNRRVLLITDALLNEGNVDAALVTDVGTKLDQHGIRLSGVGVGRDFNDDVLNKLTEKGRGAYVYLGSEAVVDRVFGPGFDSLVRTVAHEVQFSLDLPDSLAMERFYGEEMSTDAADVKPITYHAGTSQLFLQDLKIKDGTVRREDPIVLHIAYREADTMEKRDEELHTTVGALLDADPHNLHKGQALMAFADWTTALAMGADPCSGALQAYQDRAGVIADDAEIGFVNGLVGQRCGVRLATAVPTGVELKVKVDADIPISGARLSCGGRAAQSQSLSGSDTVARFTSVQPGVCRLELAGTIPMAADVTVPETGADLRCLVRGGRVSCG